MSKKEDTAYKEWLDEIRSGLPDEQKAHLDALVSFQDTGKEIFRGGIREQFLYQRLNDVKKEKDEFDQRVRQQNEWFEAEKPKNQRLVSEVQQLKNELIAYKKKLVEAGADVPEDLTAAISDAKRAPTVDNNELEQIKLRLQTMDKALPTVIGQAMDIASRVTRENYSISPRDVFQFAAEKGVDLDTAFSALTQKEREERNKKALDDQLKAAREEGAREALSKLSNPDRAMRPSGPTIFDSINTPDPNVVLTNKNARVDAAVRDFAAMGDGARGGSLA